jgi:hypothetical protein
LAAIHFGLLNAAPALCETGETPPSATTEAKPAPERSNAIRPGRTGRDLGGRRTAPPAEPAPSTAAPEQPVAPPPTATPAEPVEPPPTLTPPPAAAIPQPPLPAATQLDAIRSENEKRRLRMEEAQRQAEETERHRKEIRHRQLLEEQQEGIRRSEEARRKLWENPPR